jgi:hypothetical protein
MSEQATREMLKSALIAYSSAIEFKLGTEAASFLVNRAIENIKSSTATPTDLQLYNGAVIGVMNLPPFFVVIERSQKQLLSASDAQAMINATLSGKWHVYPWCSMWP